MSMTKVKTNKKNSEKMTFTFDKWKNIFLRDYDYDEFTIKNKKVNPTEFQYQQMMNIISEGNGYKDTYFKDRMSVEDYKEVENFIYESIQSWELYRVMWSRGIREPRDVDGVPSPVLKLILRKVCKENTGWSLNDICNLKVEVIDDDEKTHSSQSVDTIGEVYRTFEHQFTHYSVNYDDCENNGML